jgi:hypothetical protein
MTIAGNTRVAEVVDHAATGSPKDLEFAGLAKWLPDQNGLVLSGGRIDTADMGPSGSPQMLSIASSVVSRDHLLVQQASDLMLLLLQDDRNATPNPILTSDDQFLSSAGDYATWDPAESNLNSAPRVDAGPDLAIPVSPGAVASGVFLDGSVIDDGRGSPLGTLTTTWAKVSGPGTVVFGDISSPQTTADFLADGFYLLSLTADDGELVGRDVVIVSVNEISIQIQSINSYPPDLAVNISTRPTLEIICPTISPDEGQFLIAEDAAFSAIVYDSGISSNYTCSHVAFADLDNGREYYWAARLKDDLGNWTPWSVPTRFTTADRGLHSTVSFRSGVDGYSGASDADMSGSFADPATTLHERNQGAQNVLRTGRRPRGEADEFFRTLLRFDLSDLEDPESVVNVYLELTGVKHGSSELFHSPHSFYEVLRPWGEGGGIRRFPNPGDLSWTYSEFPVTWSLPGASDLGIDRGATSVIQGRLTNQIGHKTYWSSKALIDTVKRWIAQPESNYGLYLETDDESVRQLTVTASREHFDPNFRPQLVIEVSAVDCQQAADNDPCDDGNVCTSDDRCLGGVCVGGPPIQDGTVTICGVGACASSGICSGGANTCVPGAPAADDATCDGVDDDCDGQVDEDVASTPTMCGEGACASTGNLSCVTGSLTFVPSADAMVVADTPNQNFGLDMTLRTDADPEAHAYFRFDVTGIGSESVGQVVLRLTARPESNASSNSGGDLHAITPSAWEEETVTFATRPVVDGPLLISVGSIGVGEVVDLDITGAVTADGTHEFALLGASADGAFYFSSEAGASGPQLIVTLPNVRTVVDSCVPGTPAADDATCDGIDDDCDGTVDEDFVSTSTVCDGKHLLRERLGRGHLRTRDRIRQRRDVRRHRRRLRWSGGRGLCIRPHELRHWRLRAGDRSHGL